MAAPPASSWVAAAFSLRECSAIIPNTKDPGHCCCGRPSQGHTPLTHSSSPTVAPMGVAASWNPSKHTASLPTDAYGSIDFQGGPHPHKAQYARLAHDSRPDLVLSLLTQEWGLEPPKLLITVNGGKKNFELQPRLKKELGRGLLKAAKTTGAWVLTGGLSIGVTRHVGDALVTERSPRLRSGRVVSIGIAPWGIVENRHTLVQKNRDVPYHTLASLNPSSKFSPLNHLHSHFLLVDNGTVGKYGAELALRRKLERYISTQRLNASRSRAEDPYYTHCSTPLVCLIIEGGTNTIRSVLEYVTSSPPVPVVIFDGSGRAADLLAFVHRYMGEDGDTSVLDEMYEEIIQMIQRTFQVDTEQAAQLLAELVQCVKKRNLITVFRCSEETSTEECPVELDRTILNALFQSQHLSPTEQLSLALTWDREDIARKEIFRYGVEWEVGALDQAMMDALILNRVAFVTLLLERGVNIQTFLSIERLEKLYNCKQGPANTLRYLVRDVVARMERDHRYSLVEVGMVINQLMGGGYQSSYTRRKFRHRYSTRTRRDSSATRLAKTTSLLNKSLTKTMLSVTNSGSAQAEEDMKEEFFSKPFSELMIWAVLTKRQDMALIMWQHGEEAMAKALVATGLYNAMAYEAEDDDLDVEIYEELTQYSEVFQAHSCKLLNHCYEQDTDISQQLLTASLETWSRQTCLSLAVMANNRKFLSHPISQIILGDLWMGGLRMRRNPGFKIVLGLLLPPTIVHLEFKTKEELELMPQTEEEFLVQEEQEEDTSSHSSTKPSDMESVGRGSFQQESQEFLPSAREDIGLSRVPLHIGGPVKRMRPLKMKKKLSEFYGAPITKFYSHSIAYLVFLGLYTYICLVRTPPLPSVPELLVTAYVATSGLEKLRQVCALEPSRFSQKLQVWLSDSNWHLLDVGAILIFLLGAVLRWDPATRAGARVIYCTVINYFYIRILKFLAVSKYFGPVVAMMYRMVKNMLYFIVLLLVVLVSFGVCQQSIKYPNEEWHWRLLRHVFYQPYFMLYGEVYAPDIDPECSDECTEYGQCGEAMDGSLKVPCHPGRWVTPVAMTLYLLAANILILNLLIAVFNNIYQEVKAISNEVWNFQRYSIVMEYEEKPTLPPPFILFSHIFRLFRYLYRRLYSRHSGFQSGLKLFLGKEDMERLYDFEEECMEGYMMTNQRETKDGGAQNRDLTMTQNLELHTKVDQMASAILRLERLSNEQSFSRLEEVVSQTASNLAVIHRFMANHLEGERGEEELDTGRVKSRTVSENSNHEGSPDKLRMALRSAPLDRSGRVKSPFTFEPRRQPLSSPKHSRWNIKKARNLRLRHHSSELRPDIRQRKTTLSLGRKSDSDDDSKDEDELVEEDEEEEDSSLPQLEVVPGVSERGSLHRQGSHVDETESSHSGLASVLPAGMGKREKKYSRRDYTSITDELEELLPGGTQGRAQQEPTPPAIQREAELLKEAEDDDYNAFENLIERRMRRDSCNMHSSMEDMVNKSIRNSSESSSEDEVAPMELGGKLQRVQSRIRTRKPPGCRQLQAQASQQSGQSGPGLESVSEVIQGREEEKTRHSSY